MQILDMTSAAVLLARTLKKPVLFLHLEQYHDSLDIFEDMLNAAPYLRKPMMRDNVTAQAMADGYAFIVCDSDEEMEHLFWMTVGDEGPTRYNHYKGPGKVFAMTINAKGIPQNENTS